MSVLLGCIADDLTGASDLAMILANEGMRVIQVVGVPENDFSYHDADAVVIALKSRSIDPVLAVQQALQCYDSFQQAGVKQVFFKYCSTFDSNEKGNIGPVIDALMREMSSNVTIVCPAFPQNKRTVYKGHLFVGSQLLSNSPMRDHPLTPMTASNLKQLLLPQSHTKIANIYVEDIEKGYQNLKSVMLDSVDEPTIYVMDALNEAHLRIIGKVCDELSLITGGSAVAMGLADNYRARGWLSPHQQSIDFQVPEGGSVILAGSCSQVTLAQIDFIKRSIPSYQLNVFDMVEKNNIVDEALAWASENLSKQQPVLFYASDTPEAVKQIQNYYTELNIGALIERVLADIAQKLQQKGVNKFVVAGGETSGAVIKSLNIQMLELGPSIDPGVPWMKSIGTAPPMIVALKSGNFGSPDFFSKALFQLKEYEK